MGFWRESSAVFSFFLVVYLIDLTLFMGKEASPYVPFYFSIVVLVAVFFFINILWYESCLLFKYEVRLHF